MEGPSLIIFREEADRFVGQKVLQSSGTSRQIDSSSLKNQRLNSIDSWGKHLLLTFDSLTLRIHFLMYGSYRINEFREDVEPRLSLRFRSGSLQFYSCSIQTLEADPESIYDWRTDVMSDHWDAAYVRERLDARPDELVCDVVLDQQVFSGAGNIIKNEALFNVRQSPLTRVRALSDRERDELVQEVHSYSWKFYEWRKLFQLKANWRIYRKGICPDCNGKITRRHTGLTNRLSFYCPRCQPLRRRAKLAQTARGARTRRR